MVLFIKKLTRDPTLGKCDIFHELQRKKTRPEFIPTESRSNEEIFAQLKSYDFGRRCCERHLFNGGCFLNAFRNVSGCNIDNDAAVKAFICYNDKTRLNNDREKDQFPQEKFLESVISIKRNDDGDLQFTMEYSLVLNNKSVKVCRKVFAEAYGLKECDFKRCSQAMKANSLFLIQDARESHQKII